MPKVGAIVVASCNGGIELDQEKRITAPRTLWDRLRAMMDREGIKTYNEAVRHCIRIAVEASEGKAND